MPRYELFYWPEIQGRGEFVRLVLEDAGLDYVDIGRKDPDRIEAALEGELAPWAFAVPVLRAGDLVIPQTVAITRYLGERHGLAPADEAGRLHAHAIALTIADLVNEVHDTHHPISVMDVYEKQREAAAQRARVFREVRMPMFLGYLERLLGHDRTSDGRFLAGDRVSYADLAAFQVIEGLRYAFPRALARIAGDLPKLMALRDRIAERPRIASYLASPRRLPFNQSGIFRHYPELDR
ncbi:MAG: glutathione S-transferase [Myxococcales bacterium]|nr:glutathione S-transferase [Myxococcales bacterium]